MQQATKTQEVQEAIRCRDLLCLKLEGFNLTAASVLHAHFPLRLATEIEIDPFACLCISVEVAWILKD